MAQKFLDNETGLPTLWTAIGNKFVAQEAGKGLSTNDFTDEIKAQIEGIVTTGGEANQLAISNILADGTTVAATTTTDTIEIVAGENVTVSGDATAKTVTISATNTAYSEATSEAAGLMAAADKSKLDGIESGAQVNQNAFAHVAAGAVTISAASADGTFNIEAGDNVSVIGDASENKVTISATNTTYAEATTSVAGLMSAEDKAKLDDIESLGEANVIETIQVNGTAVTPVDKTVNITVPTAVSELTNDTGYATTSEVSAAVSTAISGVYVYKGSVDTADDLPNSDQTVGDVYNIVASSDYGVAGTNVAWDGTEWDALGGSFYLEPMTAAEILEICV